MATGVTQAVLMQKADYIDTDDMKLSVEDSFYLANCKRKIREFSCKDTIVFAILLMIALLFLNLFKFVFFAE